MVPIETIFVDPNDAFRRVGARLIARHFHDHLSLAATCVSLDEAATYRAAGAARLILLGLGGEGLGDTARLAALRASSPEVMIIALVYLDTPAYRQLLLAAGADAVVAKEQLATTLLPAIEHALMARNGPR